MVKLSDIGGETTEVRASLNVCTRRVNAVVSSSGPISIASRPNLLQCDAGVLSPTLAVVVPNSNSPFRLADVIFGVRIELSLAGENEGQV